MECIQVNNYESTTMYMTIMLLTSHAACTNRWSAFALWAIKISSFAIGFNKTQPQINQRFISKQIPDILKYTPTLRYTKLLFKLTCITPIGRHRAKRHYNTVLIRNLVTFCLYFLFFMNKFTQNLNPERHCV